MDIEVKCDSDKVLETLKTNRDKHIAAVKEAKIGYLEKVKKALEEKLEEISAGEIVDMGFYLPVPTDYTKEYDTAIAMLDMHSDDHIVLSSDEFKQLMLDQWGWMDGFATTNAMYVR